MSAYLLRFIAIVYLVRFAWPALSAASGAAPFGVPWMEAGQATALLDSDIRYWGVTSATIAALVTMLSFDVERYLTTLDVILGFILVGAGVRTWEIVAFGMPEGPAVVATVLEWVFPVVWFLSTAKIRREKRFGTQASTIVEATKEKTWRVFADFGAVGKWHPYMEHAGLDDGPEEGLGAARTCAFGPKMAIRETVTEWDDDGAMAIRIDFVKGMAPPIEDVEARVRVEPLGPERTRLVLSMSYKAKFGPLGGLLSEMMILGQYKQVFLHMLEAAKTYAETGATVTPVVMPGSGRVLPAKPADAMA